MMEDKYTLNYFQDLYRKYKNDDLKMAIHKVLFNPFEIVSKIILHWYDSVDSETGSKYITVIHKKDLNISTDYYVGNSTDNESITEVLEDDENYELLRNGILIIKNISIQDYLNEMIEFLF